MPVVAALVPALAGSEFVDLFLFPAVFQRCLVLAVAKRKRVDRLQANTLRLPVGLSGRCSALRLKQGLLLLGDGLVQAGQEILEVFPLQGAESGLCRILKALGILLPILAEQVELGLCILFSSDQARQLLRCVVGATLHQLKNGLQGEGFAHQ